MADLDEAVIFNTARKIDLSGERDVYLRQACGADRAVFERVTSLLGLYDAERDFLESPPAQLGVRTDGPGVTESPGTFIGRYKLLELIGEGGFAVVYMAEQTEPIRRQVALKIIKLGMDTRQVIARFEVERQALAMMDHPGIAEVYDAGATETGRPYFVMQLIRGTPITEYCDRNHLTTEARLQLFMDVCQAVQHAHQKGIIHRDIKPTNVLVALHDGRPVPKVIDFGIAKATHQRLTEKTLYTSYRQIIGTPQYMSPEQAEFSDLDIDTRSDIYSLGVLLYELLTGTTPFQPVELERMGYDEICRTIRESEPPTPSRRLSTLGDSAAAAARNREVDPADLRKLLRGDLDWIVMKALEKDRNHRYETASALAADVERYLADEPVQARPPSAMYRFRKFARRNKAAVLAATVIGAALVLTIAVLSASIVMIAQALERERQVSYFGRIKDAHHQLSDDNLGAALQLLVECPEDLRSWEWYYLMRLCRVEPLVLRNSSAVNSAVFSPDGQLLASANGDGAVKIWNSSTGEVVRTLDAHTGPVCSVAFHPDGKHLASVGADKQVKVWDLATKQQLFMQACDAVHAYGVAYSVAFNPNGELLAAGSNGSVNIWKWKHPRDPQSFPGHEKRPISVAFSHDGRWLASGSWGGQVRLWDVNAGSEPIEFRDTLKNQQTVSALAFRSDDKQLASASYNRKVDVWNTATGALVRSLPYSGLALCVAFSPDGRRIASGGEDKIVRIWDADTGREVLALRGHKNHCGSVAFSGDGQRLASASTDGTIRIWDATPLHSRERQESYTFPHQGNEVWSLAFSPDPEGKRIVSAGQGGPPKVWNARTGELTLEFDGHRRVVFCVAWHPDNQRIASAGADGELFTVKVWDSQSGHTFFELPPEPEEYFAVAFSPDRQHLVTGQADGTLKVWDARNGEKVGTLGSHGQVVRGVVFSVDGRQLASSSADGKFKLWDATRLDEKQEARLTVRGRVQGPCMNLAFSPDGSRLATGGEDYTVKIWDTQTGRELQTLRGHHGDVYTVAFSPIGRWVASAGENSIVNIWDSRDGQLVRSFRGHTRLVTSLTFSPDGQKVISGSRDKTVKFWDMTPLNEQPDK